MSTDAELLQRHCPALSYDAQEPYRAISAASMTDHPGNLLERAPRRRGSQLYVTVHDPEQPEVVLLSSALSIKGRSGEVELLLPHAVDRCLARASAFNPPLRTREELAYFRLFAERLPGVRAQDTVGRFVEA